MFKCFVLLLLGKTTDCQKFLKCRSPRNAILGTSGSYLRLGMFEHRLLGTQVLLRPLQNSHNHASSCGKASFSVSHCMFSGVVISHCPKCCFNLCPLKVTIFLLARNFEPPGELYKTLENLPSKQSGYQTRIQRPG